MLKRTASAVERIVMAWFAHRSLSRSPSPSRSRSPSRLQWSLSLSPNPSPSRSRSRLQWSLSRSPNPSPRRSQPWLRLSPIPLSRSHPSRRGSLLLAGECLRALAQQKRRSSLPPMFRQHRQDRRRDQRPTRRLFSQPLLLDPALRFHTRASRFRRPPADRRRPLRASQFRRLPDGVGGVRRQVPEEVLAVLCGRRSARRGQGAVRQDELLRL